MTHLHVLFLPMRAASFRSAFVAALAVAACTLANAQIYTGTDASGTPLLANFSSENSPVLLIAGETPAALARPDSAPLVLHRSVATPKALESAIREAARRHSVSESLLTAVIAVESGFDPRAVSPKGAKGLMQLMPDTARRFGVSDVFAVQDNLHGGAAYLSQLLALFANDRSLALAAYNAGEGAVLRAGRRIPAYPETQQYVAKVLAHAGRAAER
jgi:soluble lytic murein transglycosylase-like protein